VIGHTPTLVVTGRAEIHRFENVIMIDCGATFEGRLACLCLETGEEFYV
jgi:serine/threonine protein phosphatase 1